MLTHTQTHTYIKLDWIGLVLGSLVGQEKEGSEASGVDDYWVALLPLPALTALLLARGVAASFNILAAPIGRRFSGDAFPFFSPHFSLPFFAALSASHIKIERQLNSIGRKRRTSERTARCVCVPVCVCV